jgi:branched-chain amino acid transport system permease protein
MDFLNAIVALSNFVLIPALAYGSQLALGALGVTLIYGILRFSNFAHGDTMAIGTMVAIYATWALQGWGCRLARCPRRCLPCRSRSR